ERGDQRAHEHVDTLARLVLSQRLAQVRLVLAAEIRPLRRRGDALLTVALHAGRSLAATLLDLQLSGARLADRGLAGQTREVGRDVRDVLVRERGGLRLHRRVITRAAAIALERN